MIGQGLLSGLPSLMSKVRPQTPDFQGAQEPLLAGLQGCPGEEVRPSCLPAVVTGHVCPQHWREKKYFSLQTAYMKAVLAPAVLSGGEETHHCCFKGTKTKCTCAKLFHLELLMDFFPVFLCHGLSQQRPNAGTRLPTLCQV